MSLAYYSEHDPYAAHWLRNLIAAGHIAPGVVDERDIRDVRPEELIGFTQVHMFAGIGVWSHALRSAGWSDDRPIWTGSCPCQPFSAAGRAGGFADERHLWPHWHWLIEQCRPSIVVGEQVASKDGLGWFDLVSADLEGSGYAVGASDLCAAGIGVDWQASQSGEWLRRAIHDCVDPVVRSMLCDFADWAGEGNISEGGNHIRQRLYFVGLADDLGQQRPIAAASRNDAGRRNEKPATSAGLHGFERLADPMHAGRPERRTGAGIGQTAGLRATGGMDDDDDARSQGLAGHGGAARREGPSGPITAPGVSVRLADDSSERFDGRQDTAKPDGRFGAEASRIDGGSDAPDGRRYAKDWLFCRDDRWRAVAPSIQPLANVSAAAMVRMRPADKKALEKEIVQYAESFSRDPRQDLFDLWSSLPTPQIQEQIRTDDQFPEAEILFAFLCQLASEGWSFAESISCACEETPRARMRELWNDQTSARPSHRRGLDEQRNIEPSNPLHLLSSILARYASAAWAETQRTYAEPSFPLGRDEFARVGRLRGYGNALDAETATRFCEVVKEICDA